MIQFIFLYFISTWLVFNYKIVLLLQTEESKLTNSNKIKTTIMLLLLVDDIFNLQAITEKLNHHWSDLAFNLSSYLRVSSGILRLTYLIAVSSHEILIATMLTNHRGVRVYILVLRISVLLFYYFSSMLPSGYGLRRHYNYT